MRWTDLPIHFIDFEGSIASGVLEFGVATVLDGKIEKTATRLCGATGRIRPEDIAVHGLSPREVADRAPFSTDFEYFSGLRETGPLAAHFAHVENSLLKSVWPYPRTSPNFAGRGGVLTDWGPWIDTGRLYGELYPQINSAKLGGLISLFGLQPELDALAQEHCPEARRHYHAALYDALAAALLLVTLGRGDQFSSMTVPWLLQQSTANPDKRAALRQDELF